MYPTSPLYRRSKKIESGICKYLSLTEIRINGTNIYKDFVYQPIYKIGNTHIPDHTLVCVLCISCNHTSTRIQSCKYIITGVTEANTVVTVHFYVMQNLMRENIRQTVDTYYV